MKVKLILNKLVGQSFLNEHPDTQKITSYLGAKFLAGRATKIECKLLSGCRYDSQNLLVCESFVQAGDVCLDVGANIGVYTVLMSKWTGPGGHVHAFEPVNHVRRKLLLNVRLNGLKHVTVNSIVLGEKNGSVTMNQVKEGEFRAGTSTLTENENVAALGRQRFDRINVEMKTVDSYIEQANITKVAFVKVDIEGYEINFLRGATKLLERHRPILLMEHNQRRLEYLGIPEQEFEAILCGHEYCCFEILEVNNESYFLPYQFDRKMRSINLVCIPL